MTERPGHEGGAHSLLSGLREFLYGMTGHEFAHHALSTRAGLESIFLAVTVGDMVGLPIIPPYYSLRLLPFVVPNIATWKRRALRARDVMESHDYELHGV
jgi:hypothetical protein